jgi:hypothetical protein
MATAAGGFTPSRDRGVTDDEKPAVVRKELADLAALMAGR